MEHLTSLSLTWLRVEAMVQFIGGKLKESKMEVLSIEKLLERM
jgi:hypothetical protein